MKVKLIILLISLILLFQKASSKSDNGLRQRIDFHHAFSQKSEVTAIFFSCSNEDNLRQSLQSFLNFNTYPLKKIIVVLCYQFQISKAMPQEFTRYTNLISIFLYNGGYSMVEGLAKVLPLVQTQYFYLSDTQWKTVKGFGVIEQKINIFKECKEKEQRCYQIVTAYPFWRTAARLKQMQWTKTGQAYHEIVGLTPQYQFFTMSPSLLVKSHFQLIITEIFNSLACIKKQITAYDICLYKQINKSVKQLKLKQLYINDGTGEPNVKPLLK